MRHFDANRIKQGSYTKMTDKHSAEHSNTKCLSVDWPVCDVYIAHTTILPEVLISLTEMPFLFLQVNILQERNRRTLNHEQVIIVYRL